MNYKLLIICLIPVGAILVILSFVLGEEVIWLLSAILFTAYTLALIGLGFWLGQSSLKTGADLTLNAQAMNDNYDIKKMAAYAQFGKLVGMLGSTNNQAMLPAPTYDLFEDADFEINGIGE